MDVLDIWVNLVTPESAASFLGQDANAHIPGYLGGDGSAGVCVEQLLGVMDALGVATGVLTPAIGGGVPKSLEVADAHPAASSSRASCTTLHPTKNGAHPCTRADPRRPGARCCMQVAPTTRSTTRLPSLRGTADPVINVEILGLRVVACNTRTCSRTLIDFPIWS
jgi:hypothetical protein